MKERANNKAEAADEAHRGKMVSRKRVSTRNQSPLQMSPSRV